jgi:hypothetical protein
VWYSAPHINWPIARYVRTCIPSKICEVSKKVSFCLESAPLVGQLPIRKNERAEADSTRSCINDINVCDCCLGPRCAETYLKGKIHRFCSHDQYRGVRACVSAGKQYQTRYLWPTVYDPPILLWEMMLRYPPVSAPPSP